MLHIGSIVKLVLNVGVDVSTATKLQIKYKKPNKEIGAWPAILDTPQSIAYVVKANDLDIHGTWQFQAYVEIGNYKLFGEIVFQPVDLPLV